MMMYKRPFMVLAAFACILLRSSVSSRGQLVPDEDPVDVHDPFEDDDRRISRWKRGDDYGTGLGGPVAAGPLGPTGPSDGNSTVEDECADADEYADDASNATTSTDTNSSAACTFEKKPNQVLSSISRGDSSVKDKYLKSVICESESDCVQRCQATEQCTYFIQNTREPKKILAFLYKLDEESLRADRFDASSIFNSYIRVCQSPPPGSRRVRETSLPRKRPPGSSVTYHRSSSSSSSSSISSSSSSQSDLPGRPDAVSLPRKKPKGSSNDLYSSSSISASSSSNSADQQQQRRRSMTNADDTKSRSGEISLPRKRPHGSTTTSTVTSGPRPLVFMPSPKPLLKLPSMASSASSDSIFQKFSQTFGKKYAGPQGALRAKVFQTNILKIDKLNLDVSKLAGRDGAVYGVTPFADLTAEEFRKSHTGALKESDASVRKVTVRDKELETSIKSRPPTFDLREQGAILKIRSQGTCGSCYAFSSADLISIQNAFETKKKPKTLSAQAIADCYSDGSGCQGARVGKVMDEVSKSTDGGVPLEQCYTYQEKSESCMKNSSCCIYQKVAWSETLDLSGPKEKDLVAALLQWGPLISVIGASEVWQFHNGSGIIKAAQCTPGQQDHAILLVGYNFESPTPYYLVRNSWGEEWGDKGYAKLEAGANACSVAKTLVTACARDCQKIKSAQDRLDSPPPSSKSVRSRRT